MDAYTSLYLDYLVRGRSEALRSIYGPVAERHGRPWTTLLGLLVSWMFR